MVCHQVTCKNTSMNFAIALIDVRWKQNYLPDFSMHV